VRRRRSGGSFRAPLQAGRRRDFLPATLPRAAQTWREQTWARLLSRRAVKRARIRGLVLLPLLAAVLVAYHARDRLFGPEWSQAAQLVTAFSVLVLGWALASDLERAVAPPLFRRLDPGTAGTADFLLRLATMFIAMVAALRIAGLTPRALALGGAVTAVITGLAAQQTLGNLIAGMVLLSARPFHVGERVRLQGGGLAGTLEGVVSSLGLLYTTFADGGDPIMVPNSVVLSVAVTPLREPTGVNVRARLRPGVTPMDVERRLQESISVPLRAAPRVTLEEMDGDEVVVRIAATPADPHDGPKLAGEVLAAAAGLARQASYPSSGEHQ
jgi:small-conductance mechanosensitive channel